MREVWREIWALFLKQLNAALLQMTQNELFAGGHKPNAPQCVSAWCEGPHLSHLLGAATPQLHTAALSLLKTFKVMM